MIKNKYKKLKFHFIFISLLVLALYLIFFNFITYNFEKENKLALNSISINLLTSVHPKLSWNFEPINSQIFVKPGEVTTIEYFVENLGNK